MESHSCTWQPVVGWIVEVLKVYLGVGWQVGTTGASSDSTGVNDEGVETEVTVCVLMRRRAVQCPHSRRMLVQKLGPKFVAGLKALYDEGGCLTMSGPLRRLCADIGVEKVAHTIMFAGEAAAKPVRGGNRRRADAAAATAVEGSDEEEEEEDAEEEGGPDDPAEAGSSDGEGRARKRQKSDKSDSDSDGEGECRVPQHPVATHSHLQSPTGAHDRKTTPQDPEDTHRPPRGPTVTHNLT